MKYTKEQLESMSDLELNVLTFELKTVPVSPFQFEKRNGYYADTNTARYHVYDGDKSLGHYDVDYCNNWKDCGELIDALAIEKHGIISIDKSNLIFTSAGNAFTVKHENPKRAVAIVYILIKQESL